MKSTVKLYRTSIDLNQNEMAEKLGITQATYWNKEKRNTAFTVKEYLIMQELFGINEYQLVTLMKNMEE